MRHMLVIASLTAAFAGLPVTSIGAVEAPMVALPAVNVPFLSNLGGLSAYSDQADQPFRAHPIANRSEATVEFSGGRAAEAQAG